MPITQSAPAVLPGTVAHFAASTAPAGWIKANGAAVSRAGYAGLFEVLGTTYGVGDGSTTFNIPDMRGEFLRGLDDARGVDAGRVIGSAQASQLGSHIHTMQGDISSSFGGSGYIPSVGKVGFESLLYTDAAGGTSNGSETRPRNVALLACIKY